MTHSCTVALPLAPSTPSSTVTATISALVTMARAPFSVRLSLLVSGVARTGSPHVHALACLERGSGGAVNADGGEAAPRGGFNAYRFFADEVTGRDALSSDFTVHLCGFGAGEVLVFGGVYVRFDSGEFVFGNLLAEADFAFGGVVLGFAVIGLARRAARR